MCVLLFSYDLQLLKTIMYVSIISKIMSNFSPSRITISTACNLLVLNFEEVDWDYTLDEDKVPPLVQYQSYSDAPVRQQPYPYIRYRN